MNTILINSQKPPFLIMLFTHISLPFEIRLIHSLLYEIYTQKFSQKQQDHYFFKSAICCYAIICMIQLGSKAIIVS